MYSCMHIRYGFVFYIDFQREPLRTQYDWEAIWTIPEICLLFFVQLAALLSFFHDNIEYSVFASIESMLAFLLPLSYVALMLCSYLKYFPTPTPFGSESISCFFKLQHQNVASTVAVLLREI